MNRRLICILLAAVMLFGMISAVVMNAFAASALKTSERCIALIKQLEGFQRTPRLDYSHYSIGYGSTCEADDYPNGITEAEADALLRADIADIEKSVNKFADKYTLAFSQQQFDALISFTYNVGANWMNDPEGMFRNAVVNRSTGNEFLFAIVRWSVAGSGDNKSVQTGLVERRLIEANLYLNGIYSNGVPANYTYVIYNPNMPDCTNTIRVQGYDSSVGDTVQATPSKYGFRFLGWYSAANGGKWITTLNASTASLTLYAHWQYGDGNVDVDGNVVGETSNYTLFSSPDGEQIVREQPNKDAKALKKLGASVEIRIVADYMDSEGTKWGQLSEGGWVSLQEASEEVKPAEPLAKPMHLTVTRDDVNIRSGPGTNHLRVGKAYMGQQLTITAIQKGGQYQWGKFTGGWICLDYTDYDLVMAEQSEEKGELLGTGVVIKTNTLKVRSGPGTDYSVVGALSKGDVVDIYAEKEANGKTWYRTEKGWVHSYYLKVTLLETDKTPEEAPTEPTEPEAPTVPETSTEPEAPTVPETPTQPDVPDDKEEVIGTGTVFNCSALKIRAGAGTNHKHVGDLKRGTKVEIYEYTVVRGAVWGRIDQGWIHMSYVKLDEAAADEDAVMAIVVNCTKVNVRSGAGTRYSKVGQLAAGTKVQILQLMALSNGDVWARVSQGWIHSDYLKLLSDEVPDDSGNSGNTGGSGDSGTTTPEKPVDPPADSGSTDVPSTVTITGTIVKTDSLRVRSGPGTKYDHVGNLPRGAKVTILEQKTVGGTNWGRTAQGWISMYYVQLDVPTSTDGSVVKTVTTKLRIRAEAGTNFAHVGDYAKGTVVVILEQKTVGGRPWGRTDLGWICMDYVK